MNLTSQMADFQDLKAWIAAKEAYQASTSKPAPLTVAEAKALAQLKVRRTPDDPDLGSTDWISLLHRYRDAHRQLGIAVSFDDKSLDGQFLCTCSFRESASPEPFAFPNPDAGFVVDHTTGTREAPTFSNKRDAKRYAAKSCVQWLMAGGRMPGDGKSVAFPKPKIASPSPPLSSQRGPVDPHDNGSPPAQRVQELCRILGMPPPRYDLENMGGGLFSGQPEFSGPVRDVPDGVGRVDLIFSKKEAKATMARALLKHLLKVEAQRLELLNSDSDSN